MVMLGVGKNNEFNSGCNYLYFYIFLINIAVAWAFAANEYSDEYTGRQKKESRKRKKGSVFCPGFFISRSRFYSGVTNLTLATTPAWSDGHR